MSTNEQVLLRLRENYTLKKRQTLHREFAILRLLTAYEQPKSRTISVYKLHQDLTNEKFRSEIRGIEDLIGVGLGKRLDFAQVLRLVNGLEKEGHVSVVTGKRRAKLVSLTFKGFLFCFAFGYLSGKESVNYLAKRDKVMRALIKLFPESEQAKFTEVASLILKNIFSNLFLFSTLGMSEAELKENGEKLLYPIQLTALVGVLRYYRMDAIKPDDFNKLSPDEKGALKAAWKNYLIETKSYLENYNLAKNIYDQKIGLW